MRNSKEMMARPSLTAGAEPGFLGKSQTIAGLYRLVEESQRRVWLISPYVKLAKLRDLGREISRALGRGVAVNMVLRAPDASTSPPDAGEENARAELQEAGMRLFTVPDLHAKLYLSESAALVTSLNLLESSFNNSIEIGMFVPAGRPQFQELREFFQREIKPIMSEGMVAAPQALPKEKKPERSWSAKPKPRTSKRTSPSPEEIRRMMDVLDEEEGACIACGDSIDFDPDRPFCRPCYRDWDGDEGERQAHCHGCGKSFRSATFERPLCKPCFKDLD